jgi:dTDP-4-dehydrorhamnose 3,5-epimerase
MIFRPTELLGAFVLEPEPLEDERGIFARTWCAQEAEEHGLESRVVQCNVSYNRRKGTLRGMHWQVAPHAETKLVRCTRGAIHDVIVDIRPDSPTRGRSHAELLSAERRNMLYVPVGFAHGFLTLEDHAEVFYQMSEYYAPDAARGFRWDDPAFGLRWPAEPSVISERDRSYPDFVW